MITVIAGYQIAGQGIGGSSTLWLSLTFTFIGAGYVTYNMGMRKYKRVQKTCE